MSLLVEFLSGAEEYQDGFGIEFALAVDAYLAPIAVFPESAPVYFEKVMRGFPYGIFYEPYPTRILVAAILDLRQDPQRIHRRLRH